MPTDYKTLNAKRANHRLNVHGKRVLVVGCNRGQDCRHFVDFGAAEVHGLDVIDEIGSEFRHPKTRYHRAPVQAIPLPDGTFDLVYSFATMEHVSDIRGGFREMARVLAPGGLLYTVAAPLWNSRYGHHKRQFFEAFPWIHLRKTQKEILAYCEASGLSATHGRDRMAAHVAYMLNDAHFSKQSSWAYLDACADLPAMRAVVNKVDCEPDETLSPEAYADLAPKGYDRADLLGVTHRYIGIKEPIWPAMQRPEWSLADKVALTVRWGASPIMGLLQSWRQRISI
jgi:SAM-dependent methyltransferase